MTHHYVTDEDGLIQRAIRHDRTATFIAVDERKYRAPQDSVLFCTAKLVRIKVNYENGKNYAPTITLVAISSPSPDNRGWVSTPLPENEHEIWTFTDERISAH